MDPALLAPRCRAHHVAALWLFGSAVRADFRADSDLDVLVDFEPGTRVGLLALSRLQRELSELFGRPVDLVPVRGLKPSIRAGIFAERELLYAA